MSLLWHPRRQRPRHPRGEREWSRLRDANRCTRSTRLADCAARTAR